MRLLGQRAKNANAIDKQIELANELRMKLFNYQYPLPNYVNKIGWSIIILLIIIFAFFALLYGINFDVIYQYRKINNNNNSIFESTTALCQSNDIIHQLKNDLFETQINKYINNENDNSKYIPGSFKSTTTTTDFLYSLIMSFLLSIALWQPLNIYIFTLLKILSFVNGLEYSSNIGNILILCKNCCNKKKIRVRHIKKSLDLGGDLGFSEVEEFSQSSSSFNSDINGDRPFEKNITINKHNNNNAIQHQMIMLLQYLRSICTDFLFTNGQLLFVHVLYKSDISHGITFHAK